MENSYLMLNEIAAELESIEGIILYSMFMLPNDKARRSKFFKRVIDTGAILHAAVEGLTYLMRQIWVGGRIFF